MSPGMLVNNTCKNYCQYHTNTLAKSIADTNTAFGKYCKYQYQYFCDNTFYCLLHSATLLFPQSSINKVNRMTVVEKWQNQ